MVITDQGSGPSTDFILSRRAFGRMAQTTDAAASLLNLGVVDIEYRRYTVFTYLLSQPVERPAMRFHRKLS